MKYPFLDLKDTVASDRDEIVAAVTRVIDSGRYIGGPENEQFERQLASSLGVEYVVGTANGLDALRLIFRAYMELGFLKPGDEVIIPANTYIASFLAVSDCGLRPVFLDPDESTMNLDWTKVEDAVTDRTRAVMIVHLYGRISWNDEVAGRLRQRGIIIVEDNAQAIGASRPDGRKSGSLGDAAGMSFYPTKNIGALGDGGAVTTNDRILADTVRVLANYGSDRRYHNLYKGLNSRLDPIQAAILSVKLKRLDEEITRRRMIASIYGSEIKLPSLIKPYDAGCESVWHQYVIRVENRDAFREELANKGVGTDIHYAVPPHRQPCYSDQFGHLDLPITDRLAETVLSLPISPTTTLDDARAIAEVINRII